MPKTIVYLTKNEHHRLMVITGMYGTSPAHFCSLIMRVMLGRFEEEGHLPMLPRRKFTIEADEFKGYRKVFVPQTEGQQQALDAIATKCRVSREYMARLAITKNIDDAYSRGIDLDCVDLMRQLCSPLSAAVDHDRHVGAHLIPGGPLSTLEERNPPNPRSTPGDPV